MANENLAVMELVLGMITHRKDISKVKFWAQKPLFDPHDDQPCFAEAVPESQGISSDYIASAIRELRDANDVDIHKLMVLRKGRVLYHGGFTPWRTGIWHDEYSMSKSVTGMAVGLLISEGKLSLDTRLKDIFTQRKYLSLLTPAMNLTVRQLLTMSTGIGFNEAGAISSSSWLKGYLTSPVSGTPGKKFEYNSMNTYVLSAIVTQLTKEKLVDYLKPRLFDPLAIRDFFWEESPEHISKGGWGLFLKEEDAAKLGELYLDKGCWQGRQLIPADWVAASTHKQIDTEEGYGYGYQIWIGDRPDSFAFTGMLGQNVLAYPDTGILVVTNGGNKDLIQAGNMMNILRRYFGAGFSGEDQRLDDPKAFERLKALKRQMEKGTSAAEEKKRFGWLFTASPDRTLLADQKALDGHCYRLDDQAIGLFPIVMQVFHNNYSSGISKLRFRIEKGSLFLDIREGGAVYPIEIGFHKECLGFLNQNGEPYLISTRGTFAKDEDDRKVLKLRIAFLEDACTRLIKIYFDQESQTVAVRFNERPGNRMIREGLDSVQNYDGASKLIMGFLKGHGAIDALNKLIRETVKPETRGVIADWSEEKTAAK